MSKLYQFKYTGMFCGIYMKEIFAMVSFVDRSG
jgi:hypothetical protein